MSGAVDDVYAYLLAQGVFGGATHWTGVKRRFTDNPGGDQVVIIQEDGGGMSEQHAEAGIGDSALSQPNVLVSVRAAAWDGNASFAKALAIKETLHGVRGVQLNPPDGSTYLGVVAVTPEPIFAGFDTTGRPLHTLSYRLMRTTA